MDFGLSAAPGEALTENVEVVTPEGALEPSVRRILFFLLHFQRLAGTVNACELAHALHYSLANGL